MSTRVNLTQTSYPATKFSASWMQTEAFQASLRLYVFAVTTCVLLGNRQCHTNVGPQKNLLIINIPGALLM